MARAVPEAEQPVIEKASGRIVGYGGVGTIVIDGPPLLAPDPAPGRG